MNFFAIVAGIRDIFLFSFLKDHFVKEIIHEKKLLKLRAEVNDLFYHQHMKKSEIARIKGVSRNFVIRWTREPDQDVNQDRRGWPKHRPRKWQQPTMERIKEIHEYLKENPREFYTGATAIAREWRLKYPHEVIPPLRTIGQILKEQGLSQPRKKNASKGAAGYLCYPEYTIYHLFGGRLLEADFIGEKYIHGQSAPLNFIGFSFKKDPKLRYFRRIEAQSADCFIQASQHFFGCFEKPDFIKIDNCLATIGSASGRRNISKTMNFLLREGVLPIFSVPRKPFSQASIEGNHSVFARNFWNRCEFQSTQEIDEKLHWFNLSSQKYSGYKPNPPQQTQETQPAHRKPKAVFIPEIFFLRQVKEDDKDPKAYINVLNDKIFLPIEFINYFLLAEWNLKKQLLSLFLEKDQKSILIHRQNFTINQRSMKKYPELTNLF